MFKTFALMPALVIFANAAHAQMPNPGEAPPVEVPPPPAPPAEMPPAEVPPPDAVPPAVPAPTAAPQVVTVISNQLPPPPTPQASYPPCSATLRDQCVQTNEAGMRPSRRPSRRN